MTGFRVQNQRLMLTYRTHIDKKRLIDFINGIRQTVFIRCAHETGEGDEHHPYEHTHVVLDFGKAFQSTNCRIFDVDLIHPNIEPIKSRTHFENSKLYIAKQDPENADLKEKDPGIVRRIWSQETLQDALINEVKRPSDALGVIQLYGAKPREEYKRPPPTEWRTWQKDILTILEGPVSDRSIIWIIDKEGGRGKSVLARYIEDYMDGIMLTQMGGASHAAQILKGYDKIDNRPIIIDLPRQAESHGIYEPIEMMKNGAMTCTMYTGGQLRWRPGHLVVMANFEPDWTAWSKDRYHTITLR